MSTLFYEEFKLIFADIRRVKEQTSEELKKEAAYLDW